MKKTIASAVIASSLTMLSGCFDTNDVSSTSGDNDVEPALNELITYKIKPTYYSNEYRANIALTNTNLMEVLPKIEEYPVTVQAQDTDSVEVATIFVSSEKAGSGLDGFYNKAAKAFNKEQSSINNGKKAAIEIRIMPSGLGAQFILASHQVPDAYSPSSSLWGKYLSSQNVKLETINEETAHNVAGVVVKKSKSYLVTTNGNLDIQKLLTEVTSGNFSMGYTNPYQSTTGLNFLLTVLDAFAGGDESQYTSPDVASAFEAFQRGVPFVAQTTMQIRDAAVGSGVLDALVMEYQSWINVKGMGEYEFIPFGALHGSPLYATTEASQEEREVLNLFSKHLIQSKAEAQRFGFFTKTDFDPTYVIKDGSIIKNAQRLWKDKKSGGKPIAAVFIADTSGSMDGAKIKALKGALKKSADMISTNNAIGLITYNSNVNVDVPIGDFSVQHKSLFLGAIEGISASGGTATNDAVLTSLHVLNEYSKTHPDHKLIGILLSDGDTTDGVSLDSIKHIISGMQIPVHTIAYGFKSNELKDIAGLVEAAYIESSTDSAEYKIGNLLNAEM